MMPLQTAAQPWSMKPSGRPVDDELKAFHHVTRLLARPLAAKKEAGKEVVSAWKAMAAGRKAPSLQISHSFTVAICSRVSPTPRYLG